MKQIKFLGLAVFGVLLATSCDDDEVQDIIETGTEYQTVTFDGEYWNNLIDNQQYGGSLIYSADEYKWTDAATSLSSKVVKADWTAWGLGYGWSNGFAISNYVNPDAKDYTEQLSVTKSTGNFAVAYEDGSVLEFADSADHRVKSIDLSLVAYAYNTMVKNEAGDGYEFNVILTFKKANGAETKYTVPMASGTTVQDGFKTFEFDDTAKSITFTFDGTNKGDWGLNTPKYVAVDNIVVEK